MAGKGVETRESLTLEELEQRAKAAPDERDSQCRYAWGLFGAGQYEAASKVFLDASRRWPEDIEVHYGLGLSYRRLGDKEKAEAAFSKVSQLEPPNLRAGMMQRMSAIQAMQLSA